MRNFLLLLLAALPLSAQTVETPVRAVTDPGVVTTRQAITPAGVQAIFQGRVYGVSFGADASEIHVLQTNGVYRMDWKANRVLSRAPLSGRMGLQGIQYDAGARRALVVYADGKKAVRLAAVDGAASAPIGGPLGANIGGALALAGKTAAVPLISENALAVVDLAGGRLRGNVKTGVAPFGVALDREGGIAYVTNWGGRIPRTDDLTAPTGLRPDSDRVVVDARGVASTGTVTRIDLGKMAATDTIPVGLHPTALAWDQPRGRLYVANSNSDTVSVIDTARNSVIRTIEIQPFPAKAAGIAPTAMALSADGADLYVACGGINAVAVVSTAEARVRGTIPTGWYPNALALSPDGHWLAVATLLGAGSGWRDDPSQRFVHSQRGSVAVLAIPDRNQLAGYTTAVAENNHMTLAPAKRAPASKPVAIPARSGDPSSIQHVVYIVKENRTYDQVLGDVAKGNGEPKLAIFGEPVTPNHHRLAEQFVLLDNFYATGGNSGDGHQWVTQANETAYCLWPGYEGRSYPFDGSDPIAYAAAGFIWDAALARNKTVRVFGEYAGRLAEPPAQRKALLEAWKRGEDFTSRWKITAPIAALNKILAPNYPTYTNAIPDVVRAQIFLADLNKWVAAGSMPHLTIIQLPSNHTYGTMPDASTPKAMVADNDLALGRIVEALTKTPFWKKMAIFVVEDDAQNGVDHVDGHRTVAFAISPYTRRGSIDSTFYSHQSMVKTIELILGLPTLSLFDLIAYDMRNSFQDEADFTPYEAVEATQSLFEMNPPLKALRGPARKAAIDSAAMRWDVPDAAPVERLNRIVWGAIKGWDTPYPVPPTAVFSPMAIPDEE
ncbi:MAG TPA: alkaline phosphatase family protein [Bryobacteraceae bacterium]|nr:alkaline phosphatase family protein [Bryobacteraceae bacterium]